MSSAVGQERPPHGCVGSAGWRLVHEKVRQHRGRGQAAGRLARRRQGPVRRSVEFLAHRDRACGERDGRSDQVLTGCEDAATGVVVSGGSPLDSASRTDMESRLGADFSDVRIHTGSAAKASAAEMGARAYTSGSHVVIGDGGADRHTLAHELTHVIQQRKDPSPVPTTARASASPTRPTASNARRRPTRAGRWLPRAVTRARSPRTCRPPVFPGRSRGRQGSCRNAVRRG